MRLSDSVSYKRVSYCSVAYVWSAVSMNEDSQDMLDYIYLFCRSLEGLG